MKTEKQVFEGILNAAAVDECSEHIREFLAGLKLTSREITRYTISAEEILLDYLGKSDTTINYRLKTGKKFARHYITLEIGGERENIFTQADSEQGVLGGGMLKNLGLSPEYSYAGGYNTYSFRLKKKPVNPFLQLFISIAAALAVGFAGKLVPDVCAAVLNNFITPIYDTFFNILGCVAGPMVFLAVAWGIYGIGDAVTLKRIGKKLITGYTSTVFCIAAIFAAVLIPLFKLKFSASSGESSDIYTVFSMILGIIPKNVFSPFVDGNTLQIIFLATVMGIAMLFLGQKTTAVAKAVEQINYIVNFLIEFISKLIPYFIFIVLVNMMWSDSLSQLSGVGKMLITFVLCSVGLFFGVSCWCAAVNRVSPLTVIRKGLPTFVIAFTTASSAAAFGTNMEACRKRYGINDTISSFGVPLGMVTFKPTTALSYIVLAFTFAELYGIEISLSWILLLVLSAAILALATPPIPGGAMAAYTVLFSQLGIPTQALAVALACDTIIDFICTGCDQYTLPLVLLNQANKLGMVNRETLKSKTSAERK